MSIQVSKFDDLNKQNCGDKCTAVLEVSDVKKISNSKLKRTIIQARTEDKKYLVITHNKIIDIDLKPGDIIFLINTVVGRYKDKNNHFNYNWELRDDSQIILLSRDGPVVPQSVFPGASNSPVSNPKKPSVNTKIKPLNVCIDDIQLNTKPSNKPTGPKTVHEMNIRTKAENPLIKGYLHKEFQRTKYIDDKGEMQLFVGEVEAMNGDIVQVAVRSAVQLPILLKKGHFLHVAGKDINLDGKTTRLIASDTELYFKGVGHAEEMGEKKDDIKKLPIPSPKPKVPIPPPRVPPQVKLNIRPNPGVLGDYQGLPYQIDPDYSGGRQPPMRRLV